MTTHEHDPGDEDRSERLFAPSPRPRIQCECEHHPDAPCRRDAWATVTRCNGSRRRVCDRCDFSTDIDSTPLAVPR